MFLQMGGGWLSLVAEDIDARAVTWAGIFTFRLSAEVVDLSQMRMCTVTSYSEGIHIAFYLQMSKFLT